MSTTSSGKRKRATPVAFYAVKVGRVPGIYQTWDEASQQTVGFPGHQVKKFSSLTEAEAMMNGTTTSTTKPKPAKTKYYGVAAGRVPGVYTDYDSVRAQTTGFPGAKQKGFSSPDEAQAYVDEFKRAASRPISLRGDLSETSSLAAATASKKQKKESIMSKPVFTNGDIPYEPGMGPLPPDAEDGFDQTITLDPESGVIRAKTGDELGATKSQSTGDFSGPMIVYTDGSSLGNGQLGAVAGIGVWFGRDHKDNISEPLRGVKQTNQRAELVAVARALDIVPIDRAAKIVLDSHYTKQCLTVWNRRWEGNNWKTNGGKDVENRDLIEPIVSRIREREMCRAETAFEWVKGHSNDEGNNGADALAVAGSNRSTHALRNAPEISQTLTALTRSHNTDGEFDEDAQEYIEAFDELAQQAQNRSEFDKMYLVQDSIEQV